MPSVVNLDVVYICQYGRLLLKGVCLCVPEDEREQVERLRWPSRGYLQELSEYQQRRRKLRKSRCIVMWPPPGRQNPVENKVGGEQGGIERENNERVRRVINEETEEKVFTVCPAGWRSDSERHCCSENITRLLNRQDSVIKQWHTPPRHASLPPEQWLCVLCIMTIPSWAMQNDTSLKPNMNIKWLAGHRLFGRLYFCWWMQNGGFQRCKATQTAPLQVQIH